jgi:hypothetical protein
MTESIERRTAPVKKYFQHWLSFRFRSGAAFARCPALPMLPADDLACAESRLRRILRAQKLAADVGVRRRIAGHSGTEIILL